MPRRNSYTEYLGVWPSTVPQPVGGYDHIPTEPLIFVKCRPGCRLPVQLSSELGGATIIIDCDFDGITPLHYPLSKPKYE